MRSPRSIIPTADGGSRGMMFICEEACLRSIRWLTLFHEYHVTVRWWCYQVTRNCYCCGQIFHSGSYRAIFCLNGAEGSILVARFIGNVRQRPLVQRRGNWSWAEFPKEALRTTTGSSRTCCFLPCNSLAFIICLTTMSQKKIISSSSASSSMQRRLAHS